MLRHAPGMRGAASSQLAVVERFNDFKETREGSAAPTAWPRQVLENLSTKLNDEFVAHMRARDHVSVRKA